MLVIGLTGGVATGKSTAAKRFAELGARVFDADRFAREAVEIGEPALEEIRDRFGEKVIAPDGSLDRRALGGIVFRDEKARRDLEAIVHPRVRQRMIASLDALREEGYRGVAILEIPLLFESKGSLELVERVVVVYAPRSLQVERLMRRSQLSREEALLRIDAQLPIDEKAARADYVVDNSTSLDELFRQVERLWEEWGSECGLL